MKLILRISKDMRSKSFLILIFTVLIFLTSYFLMIKIREKIKQKPLIKNSIRSLVGHSIRSLKKSIPGKTILFWTGFWGEHSLKGWNISRNTLKFCPMKCTLTMDRRYLLESDAVIFQVNSIYSSHIYPVVRPSNQIWVYFRIEPPNFYDLDHKPYNQLFNWTMTYRSDSDIPCPYGWFDKNPINNTINSYEILKKNTKKSKLIAWAVSHCKTKSQRELFVQQLNQYIQVDIFGTCGIYNCTKSKTHMWKSDGSCYREIANEYKFYLSFEHTLCKDYITEKFFMALHFDIIPIVYGGINNEYENIAPKYSYINVNDFKSIKELADYLLFLDQNHIEYMKYFEWKKTYFINQDLSSRWCNLCEKVWNINQINFQIYDDIGKWWGIKENGDDDKICKMPRKYWI